MPAHCKDTTSLNTLFTELSYLVNKVTISTVFPTLSTMNSMDIASIDNVSYAGTGPIFWTRSSLLAGHFFLLTRFSCRLSYFSIAINPAAFVKEPEFDNFGLSYKVSIYLLSFFAQNLKDP